ncbi:MAG: type II secretion system F family protein [Planctomycetota bacterium]
MMDPLGIALLVLLGAITLLVFGSLLVLVARIAAAPKPSEGGRLLLLALSVLGWVLITSAVAAACLVAMAGLPGILALVVLGMVVLRYRRARQHTLLSTLAVAAERLMPLAPVVEAFAEERGGLAGLRTRRLAGLLRAGVSLPDALYQTPGLVSRQALVTIRVGQESGALAQSLGDVVKSHQLHAPVWNQTMGRALYLSWVLVFGVLLVAFTSLKIAPEFRKIFEEFDVALPPITEWTIAMANAFAQWGFLTVPLVLALVLGFLLVGVQYVAGVRWSLPLMNWFTRRLDTAQILEALALAAERNVPFQGKMETLAKWYPRGWVRKRLRAVVNDMKVGLSWSTSLARHGLIRQAEVAVFQSAGRAGNLSWALREMADSNRRRLNYRVYTLGVQVLFPLAVLTMGLLVMIYVVSYFLPLVHLITSLA